VAGASYHEPVLVEEALAAWVTDPRGRYLDGTIGGGGHADHLLSRHPEAELIGLDRDPEALVEARRRLAPHAGRVRLFRADYADMEDVLAGVGGPPPAGILLDLGVSSRQLDDPRRGFSYLSEGPLRLTLDRDATRGAAELLAEIEEGELKRIFRELGELPAAGRAARAVVGARRRHPLDTTSRLVDALRAGGVTTPRRLSQAFQALRLAVNDELGSLRRGLDASARVLPPGGTLTVISFESLMDRMVKRTFRPPRFERPLPGVPDREPRWEVLTRKAVRPGPDELARNPRSRSARLRAARRTAHA
jgi:16S rRNA (cytosine1402-N4)-methyltransferase